MHLSHPKTPTAHASHLEFHKLRTLPSRSFIYSYATLSALTATLLVVLILGLLAYQSGSAIFEANDSLLGSVWSPAKNQYGILPMLYGSLIVMVLAMGLALPIGILTALYISETRSETVRRLSKTMLEILAGIPSIVYGLIGVAFLSLWVADIFYLQTGRVILTASLLLAIMILPTIITLTEDAFSNVATPYRENAYALGLYRFEVIKEVILPQAKGDVIGAAFLALGRALGETMAVMLVIGSLDRIPTPAYNILSSAQTITSKLGREIAESAFGSTHFNVLVLMSLILVVITLSLTGLAHILFKSAGSND